MAFLSPAEVFIIHGLLQIILAAMIFNDLNYRFKIYLYLGQLFGGIGILLALNSKSGKVPVEDPSYRLTKATAFVGIFITVVETMLVSWQFVVVSACPNRSPVKYYFLADIFLGILSIITISIYMDEWRKEEKARLDSLLKDKDNKKDEKGKKKKE